MTVIEHEPEHFTPTAEEDRVARRAVWLTGAVGAALIVGCTVVADLLLHGAAHGEPLHTAPPPAASAEIGRVEQSLVEASRRGLEQRDEQRRSLDQWGWVDRPHGVARIPIDRAMDLVVQKGASR